MGKSVENASPTVIPVLAEETHRGIPRAVFAFEQPAPIRDYRQREPNWHTQSAREMGNRSIRTDHQI